MVSIQPGEAFALLAFRSRSEIDLAPAELLPDIYVSSSSTIGLDQFWRTELGNTQFENFQSCTLFLLAKDSASAPLTSEPPQARVLRSYNGIILAERFGIEHEPFLITGLGLAGDVAVNQVSHLHPTRHIAADPWHKLSIAEVHRGLEMGEAIKGYPWQGAHRLNRVLSLYMNARTLLDWMDRLHQYTRCLDGLTVPPGGGTGKKFAERMTLLVGPAHQALFEDIYKIRGAIEHLRENDYTEPYSRAGRLELVKKAGIVEFVARSALVRILESPSLWTHFSNKAPLEAFWAMPLSDRGRLWGNVVDPMDGLIGFDEKYFSDQDLGGP